MKNASKLFEIPSLLNSIKGKVLPDATHHLFITKSVNERKALVKKHGFEFLLDVVDLSEDSEYTHFHHLKGNFHFINLSSSKKSSDKAVNSELESGSYVKAREVVGAHFVKLKKRAVEKLNIHFGKLDPDSLFGSFVGLEMAAYSYTKQLAEKFSCAITVEGKAPSKNLISKAQSTGHSVNLSRHLVNLPPNLLNPVSYAEAAKSLLKGTSVSVEVWDEKRLEKEGLTLLCAVGQGSITPPRLLKISYRPGKSKSKKAKYAFVGKGITFDTGGLDLKPSRFMRLMKKDMGGSASVMGLANYVAHNKVKHSIDFYIALAENSVGANAFRPGDIYKSRKGHSVEIDNTDAEGRLALADAITVAIDESSPEYLIDLATLTGAGKVALGSEIASLFTNDKSLNKKIMNSSTKTGDWAWQLPLFEKYNSLFPSSFADFQNSAVTGYGGAITAALFLKKFVDCKDGDTPKWAHLDIYGWKDAAEGPFESNGGNGQCVQSLIHYLETV